MPDEKAGVPQGTAVKENGSDVAKPAPESSPPPKESEPPPASTPQIKAEQNGAGTAEVKTEQTAEASGPVKRRLSFQRIVPLLVLLLAAGILLAITGGWNRLVGSSSTQKTDD